MITYFIGIDEAGRGPLAGPVAVGAFCVEVKNKRKLKKMFVGARDSKKMSAGKREEVFGKIQKVVNDGNVVGVVNAKQKKIPSIKFVVIMENAKVIDEKGISWTIRNCIRKCLKKLTVDPKQTLVLLDGSLKAPTEFAHQKTIIKGDDKEMVISLASICAKVTRDAYMKKLAKKYPQYGFEVHKGYGTKAHRTAIKKYKPSKIHRKSFLKNIAFY